MAPVDMDNLVDTHGAAVYRFCARLTGTRQEAEELFQQTFLRCVELARRIDADRNPRGFLMAIAAKTHRRNATKAGRRQRILPQAEPQRDGVIPDAPDPANVEEDAAQAELRQAVRDQVQALPEKLKLPVMMLYAGGLSVEDIAGATGLRPGTVKSRLFAARKLIRAGLEAKGYGKEEI